MHTKYTLCLHFVQYIFFFILLALISFKIIYFQYSQDFLIVIVIDEHEIRYIMVPTNSFNTKQFYVKLCIDWDI